MTRPLDRTDRIRRASHAATAAWFLAALAAGGAGTFVDLDPAPPIQEKRARAAPPRLEDAEDLPAFGRATERWLDDHFGLRDALLRLNSRLRVLGLRSSPSERVAVGSDGWLFLRGESSEFHAARAPFSPAQLDAWVDLLRSRRDDLARRGCRYLLAFVPTKATMYPERLPRSERRRGAQTRLEQLRAHLSERGVDVPVLYLEDALRPRAAEAPLYYRTDSHWNAEGAYLGYRAIADALHGWFPEVRPLSRDEVTLAPSSSPPDLALVLGLEHHRPEATSILVPRRLDIALQPLELTPTLSALLSGRTFAAGTGRAELPRAVIFRDSFTVPLEAVLPALFERAVLAGPREKHAILEELIDAERPDVVVSIECERFLMMDPPSR